MAFNWCFLDRFHVISQNKVGDDKVLSFKFKSVLKIFTLFHEIEGRLIDQQKCRNVVFDNRRFC